MIYLDNAATTAVFPEVLDAMFPWFYPDRVGNASSIHTQGTNAHDAIEEARARVAKMINADPSEIFFTSGGTESNNAWLKCFDGSLVLTTLLEHDSVLEPLMDGTVRYPQRAVRFIKVNRDGSVDLSDLERVLDETRNIGRAVSMMWVNNELGTVNPMEEIGTLCKKYNAPFHTDAVQAAGHVPIDVKAASVDFLSLSGHKFGAPTGVGVLFVRNGIFKHPLILGGGQEMGMRGGTYNVPGIVGIGKAAELVDICLRSWRLWWGVCREAFLVELHNRIPEGFYINGGTEDCHSNIISLTIPGVNSEALLLLLDQQEIYLSAGSACSAANSAPSHVLKGIGMSDEDAASTVRISMGFGTRKDEMKQAAKAIAEAAHKLKAMYP